MSPLASYSQCLVCCEHLELTCGNTKYLLAATLLAARQAVVVEQH